MAPQTPAGTQEEQDSLPSPSRLYTFVDGPVDFALYFFDGQRLIHDLALTHGTSGEGFPYFRDVVLSIQLLLAFLNRGEQFGFYVDADEPYFRLKIEAGHHGDTRCALVPHDVSTVPRTFRGLVRLVKLFGDNRPPYQSVIEVDGAPLGQLVNRVLAESYQIPSRVVLSEASDQSAMLHRLPASAQVGRDEDLAASAESLAERLADELSRIFVRAPHRVSEIESAFGELGFRLIASRPVRLACSCSRGWMLRNLWLVLRSGTPLDDLFEPQRDELQIVCEYCKTSYTIARAEVAAGSSPIH